MAPCPMPPISVAAKSTPLREPTTGLAPECNNLEHKHPALAAPLINEKIPGVTVVSELKRRFPTKHPSLATDSKYGPTFWP